MAGVAALVPGATAGCNDGARARPTATAPTPHKWLLTELRRDLFWVADRAALIGALSILPEYLRNAATEAGAVIDYRDWQIPLGRRFRALKLWFVLRWYGPDGLRARSASTSRSAPGWPAGADADELELTAPPLLGLVCFHHVSGDQATQAMLARLNADPTVHLTHTRLAGRYTIRVSIGQTGTRRAHVENLWQLISSASRPA